MNNVIYMFRLTSTQALSTYFRLPHWSFFIGMKIKTLQLSCRPTRLSSHLYFHGEPHWHAHKPGTSFLTYDTLHIQVLTSFSTRWWFAHVFLLSTHAILPNRRKPSIYSRKWPKTKKSFQPLALIMLLFWLVLNEARRVLSTRDWG